MDPEQLARDHAWAEADRHAYQQREDDHYEYPKGE